MEANVDDVMSSRWIGKTCLNIVTLFQFHGSEVVDIAGSPHDVSVLMYLVKFKSEPKHCKYMLGARLVIQIQTKHNLTQLTLTL